MLPILFIIALVIDLILTAAKIGFTNSRFEKLLTANGQSEAAAKRAATLLTNRPKLVFSMQTIHVVLRVLMTGLLVAQYIVISSAQFTLLPFFGILLGAALLLALIEQFIEASVLRNPEKWAIRLSSFTSVLLVIGFPILAIPQIIFKLFPAQQNQFFRVNEEELNMILDASQRQGMLEVDEREMINSIFLFREKSAREIMIPRIDLLTLPVETPLLDAIDSMLKSGYSRVPVFDESIDNILGVLYIKDLLRLYRDGQNDISLRENLRPAYFIPETKKVGELLAEMQSQHNHIAIVVDEYGGLSGIATLEDIVEEIVGEIQDEYDPVEENLFQKVSDDEFVFQAKIDINEFNQIMGSELPKETADTLGGLLYSWFGRIPKPGETAESDDILFTVEQVTGRRIQKVRAIRPEPSEKSTTPSQDPVWY